MKASPKRQCPFCGSPVEGLAINCQSCGSELLLPQSVQPWNNYCSATWLAVLLLASFGVYALVWGYKGWKFLRQERAFKVSLGLNTFGLIIPFVSIFVWYRLLSDIKATVSAKLRSVNYSPGFLVVTFGVTYVGLSRMHWSLGILASFVLVPVQQSINEYWIQRGLRNLQPSAHFFVIVAVGALVWGLIALNSIAA